MSNNFTAQIFILLFLTLQIPFLIMFDFENLVLLNILNIIVLMFISLNKLFKEFKSFYIVTLGYVGLIFLDITKYNFIHTQYIEKDYVYYAFYFSYVSYFIYVLVYIISSFNFKAKVNNYFNVDKFNKIIIPLSALFLLFYTSVDILIPSLSDNPILILIGFFPKATTIFMIIMYLKTRNKIYIILSLVFILFTFTETSRRVYITFLFIVIPVILSYIIYMKIRIKFIYKFLFVVVLISFFIFLNYLRSTHNYGEGYDPNNKIKNTINYIVTLKSLDTFYNTAYVIKNFPNKYEYYYGETYISVLFMLLPRSLWEEKPIGFAAQLGVLQRLNTQEFSFDKWNSINKFSLSPGFIGEAYANLGFLGIIILSILFGLISKLYDTRIKLEDLFTNYNILPYMSFYGSFFLLLRGDFFSALYFSIFYFLFFKIIIRVCK